MRQQGSAINHHKGEQMSITFTYVLATASISLVPKIDAASIPPFITHNYL